MIDFAEARQMMVEGQVHTYDVTDLRVLAAMLAVPREYFVPEDKRALAYADRDLPVTNALGGRTPRYLLKPAVLARLIQGAEVVETDRVLDVGCATGYSSAVLGKLAGSVIALEEDSHLAAIAREQLAAIGATNVTVIAGPLMAGAAAQAQGNDLSPGIRACDRAPGVRCGRTPAARLRQAGRIRVLAALHNSSKSGQ